MSRKWILPVIIIAILVFFGGGYLWMHYKFAEYKQDGELTDSLPEYILNKFKNGKNISAYPFKKKEIDWKDNVLILEDYPHKNYSIRYISLWNDELGTSDNRNEENVKGLVLIKSEDKLLDRKEVSQILESEQLSKKDTAYRRFTSLQYFDLHTECIIAQDTVWGKMPDKEAIQDGLGYGRFPKNKDVLISMKNRLGFFD
ncbi:MAG TPA: hypothetical protein VK102_10330 [Sphingobacterium sp.]|nr:hypothetical protein [Sphingobacterium sp.]